MTTILTKDTERDILREAGRRLGNVLKRVAEEVCPGITTLSLDVLAEKLIRDGGDEPAFLNYTPDGADRPFPKSLCVSVNDEVVHGVPGSRILKDGDIVGLDLGLKHKGFFVDSAMSVPVGKVSKEAEKLIAVTKEALLAGIKAIRPGKRIGDISSAIESVASKRPYGIVRILGGHGIGRHVHEMPYVPNFGEKGKGPVLKDGMLLAIEPMLTVGSEEVDLDEGDGYTFRTADGSMSAHFEHTILVTSKGAEILTLPK